MAPSPRERKDPGCMDIGTTSPGALRLQGEYMDREYLLSYQAPGGKG